MKVKPDDTFCLDSEGRTPASSWTLQRTCCFMRTLRPDLGLVQVTLITSNGELLRAGQAFLSDASPV